MVQKLKLNVEDTEKSKGPDKSTMPTVILIENIIYMQTQVYI
jgi:hypothetical protein